MCSSDLETMEDYALRFAPRSFRKWSEARVAATALGSISFLALEAIGGAVMVSYGFTNAVCAIVAVALVITQQHKSEPAKQPQTVPANAAECAD